MWPAFPACSGHRVRGLRRWRWRRRWPRRLAPTRVGPRIFPGQATEADVAAAWRDAPYPERDQSLGGTDPVRLNERPAIVFDLPGNGEAWLVTTDGEPRVARLVVPIVDDCAAVLAAMGDRYKPSTCRFTNRKPDVGEHRGCAHTPDGRRQISIDCLDRRSLEFWVHWEESTYSRVSIRRPSRR